MLKQKFCTFSMSIFPHSSCNASIIACLFLGWTFLLRSCAIYAKGSQLGLDQGNWQAKFLVPNPPPHLSLIYPSSLKHTPDDTWPHLPSSLHIPALRCSPPRSQTSLHPELHHNIPQHSFFHPPLFLQLPLAC